jgi:hypothetical protein
MEGYVLSLVHHTHPSAPKLLDDAVVRDGLADHWGRILRLQDGQVNESRGVGGWRESPHWQVSIILLFSRWEHSSVLSSPQNGVRTPAPGTSLKFLSSTCSTFGLWLGGDRFSFFQQRLALPFSPLLSSFQPWKDSMGKWVSEDGGKAG